MIQKLKDAIFPHIGNISIGVGITGLLAHLLHLLFFQKPDAATWLFALYPVQIEDYVGRFLFRSYQGPKAPALLLMLFSVMMIAGGLLYKKTDGKDARLLRFGYAVMAVHKGIMVLSIPLNFVFIAKMVSLSSQVNPRQLPDFKLYILFTIPAMVIAILSFWIAKWLVEEQKMRVYIETGENDTQEYVYYPLPRKKRLAHWFFDLVLAILIVSPLVFTLFKAIDEQSRSLSLSNFRMNWAMSLILIASLTLYYLLFEGLFHATPAKFITGSRVLDAQNFEKPTFGAIFLRTICRRIPFEAFSFFGKRGWHDSISDTVVVEEEHYDQKRGYHVVWGILFVLLYVGGFTAKWMIGEYVEGQHDAQYKEARENTRKVTSALQPGDCLLASLSKYQSGAKDLLLEIEKSERDSFFCMVSEVKNAYDLSQENIERTRKTAQYVGEIALPKAEITAYTAQEQPYSFAFDQQEWRLKSWVPVHFATMSNNRSSYSEVDGLGTGQFGFQFSGPSLEILKGTVVSGSVALESTFPMQPHYSEESRQGVFSLKLGNIGKFSRNTIELTVLMEGREQIYVIKGFGTQWVAYPKP